MQLQHQMLVVLKLVELVLEGHDLISDSLVLLEDLGLALGATGHLLDLLLICNGSGLPLGALLDQVR